MNRTLAAFAVFVLLLGILYAGTRETAKNTHSDAGTALMRLDKGTYRVGEDLTLTIINTGSETLLVGASYRLYRLENGGWEELNLGFSFTGIGYTIPSGGNWSQTVPLATHVSDGARKLEPLPPGRYMITKTVIIDRGRCGGRSDEIILSAEFEVVG
ncbi:hypothetical protein GQS_00820 [Thermococcus sp. 4557]|uniref:immunoglobulin-like domain-containing protein n=1 Tax=Thermococcus sp. (strain CGMCC 1.5172 / 4557) TaxID=1042877 RepID=UPI000219E963|nr:immunoglobulin-like domain-containing protein [Thermococcus sp. 4557]AEK72067.1 hypothetical protein GQS_00820 [Thermococcus sp. 4557]